VHHAWNFKVVPVLCLQNGTLKSKVHGANIPALLSNIADAFTPLPGLDDLEVNKAVHHTESQKCHCRVGEASHVSSHHVLAMFLQHNTHHTVFDVTSCMLC
jgi:hypothetical protein